MKTAEFDYEFPRDLIAQRPAAKRDHSRLMVLHRDTQAIENRHFYDILDYLQPGDLLVLNDTKVIPANLVGRKIGGSAKIEILLVKRCSEPETERLGFSKKKEPRRLVAGLSAWECLVKPGKRLKVGAKISFGRGQVIGTVMRKLDSGEQIIRFQGDLEKYMERKGEIPLPPYIRGSRRLNVSASKGETATFSRRFLSNRYQTVYAEKEGASAAPTAGLHFTPALLKKIRKKGVKIAKVTLHTGLATFKPVYAENVEDHKMYSEYFEVPAATSQAVKKAKRVIAVGTTSVRVLESAPPLALRAFSPLLRGRHRGGLKANTNLFIYPGYRFKVIDAMITNFHWPRSTLIMLVSAFAGKDFVFRAYQEAVHERYRLFSFGDAMLIL